MHINGSLVLITGASSGIGAATARAVARAGGRPILVARTRSALEAVAAEIRAAGGQTWVYPADLADPAAVEEAASQIMREVGVPDILIHSAGAGRWLFVEETTATEAMQMMAAPYFTAFYTTRAVLPAMLSQRAGSIINISSVASSLKGAPNRYVYGSTKAAIIGLTKSVAVDFAAHGIRCNAICPGTVDTPSLAGRINTAADPVQARKDFIARQPMGRLGSADEIAHLAVYLAGDEAGFTSGATHIIDGAWSA